MMGSERAAEHGDSMLRIFVLDMDGGSSTLVVTPAGESVLIDTGSLHPSGRDAGRIVQACTDAGVSRIDYLVTTHFDSDHYGAIKEVSDRLPVGEYFDNGCPESQSTEDALYREATRGQATALRPGDDIPLRPRHREDSQRLRLHCVAAAKRVEGYAGDLDSPVPGYEFRPPDATQNARSVALVLTYGPFKAFLGGDITWNVEHHLALPRPVVGLVDLYLVSHHGLDHSNNPVFVRSISPTVCVVPNGHDKGPQPGTFGTLSSMDSVTYQLHRNTEPEASNVDPDLIANDWRHPPNGNYIVVDVAPGDAGFTVSVPANGHRRLYPLSARAATD